MKVWFFAALALALAACSGRQTEVASLETFQDSLSYSIGVDIGRGLARQDIVIDPAILGQGLREAYADSAKLLTPEEVQGVLIAFQRQAETTQREAAMAKSQVNKEAGEKFLAENAKKDGVITLPSGLQYRIIRKGDGPKPKATDKVKVHYKGELVDGTIFDSSYQRGEPVVFPVSGLIDGWTEALQLMPVGSKWELVIPPSLAYGDRGAGSTIPSESTLRFEMELLGIE